MGSNAAGSWKHDVRQLTDDKRTSREDGIGNSWPEASGCLIGVEDSGRSCQVTSEDGWVRMRGEDLIGVVWRARGRVLVLRRSSNPPHAVDVSVSLLTTRMLVCCESSGRHTPLLLKKAVPPLFSLEEHPGVCLSSRGFFVSCRD